MYPYIYVAPYVGAWIETGWLRSKCQLAVSHPMWVRGLKHKSLNVTAYVCASHPMWVRGLKLLYYTRAVILRPVAPYVGAWIETLAGDL